MNNTQKYLEEFLKACHKTQDINGILCLFAHFVEEKYPPSLSAIIGIISSPYPFVRITETPLTTKIINEFNKQNFFEISNIRSRIKFEKYFLFPIFDNTDFLRFIVVFSELPHQYKEDVQFFLSILQRVVGILFSHRDTLQKNSHEYTADLLSHMTHDINSLIAIIQEQNSISTAVSKKISYMERLNQDLLFYLRDLEFAPVRINSEKVFRAILSEIQISNKIDIIHFIEKTDLDLFVDVELLDLALNKIIENAIRSAQLNGKKIQIKTQTIRSHPLSNHRFWLSILICDNGPGIPNDFIDRLKRPFFTTFKAHGHSGFGLSIAEKIIHVHKGIMNIKNLSDGGAQVEILLPLEEKK